MRETTIFPICSESRLMSHDSFSTRSCCCWRNQVPRILNVSVKHSRLAESPARGKLKIPIQWKFIQDYSKHKCVISLFSIIPHRTACGIWITNGASHWRWRRNKPAEDYRWGAEHSDKATYRLGSRNVLQQLGQKRSWVRFGIVVYELIIEFFGFFVCYLIEAEENQTPSTSEHPDHLPLPSNYNESAVFYGPDGQIVSWNESWKFD